MSISVKLKKEGLKRRIDNHPYITITKKEVDKWDTEMYGDVVINGNIKNPVKTHVSEVFQELEESGKYRRNSIPGCKKTGRKILQLIRLVDQ
jgi:hypothetical protein